MINYHVQCYHSSASAMKGPVVPRITFYILYQVWKAVMTHIQTVVLHFS